MKFHMQLRDFPSIISFSLILLLSACGSSPDAKFYTLSAMPRDVSQQTLNNVVVKVGPVTLPDTLDQAQIVTRAGSNKLHLDEFNVWAGDLQDDFQRILGENISILLPTEQVVLYQEISLSPVDFQIIVNVRQFDGTLGGTVTLNADWSVVHYRKDKRKNKTVIAKKAVFQDTAVDPGYQAYVAAQSRLLGKLSTDISAVIKKQAGRDNEP